MSMKKIVVIGSKGQLGQYLVKKLVEKLPINSACPVEVIELSREQLDLENNTQIAKVLIEYAPDMLINASAYTAVDKAESEAELAMQINRDAPKVMAEYAVSANIPFIHYSTDYVFAGNASSPYQENDAIDPQGQYGLTKLAGEQAILETAAQAYIFRTAWVYSQKGNNFYKTMLKLAETRSELNVVADQVGTPTYAASIAEATVEVVNCLFSAKEYESGIYHMTCGGVASWAEFAEQIFKQNNIEMTVNGISSSEYPTPAKRPEYSVLSNQKLKSVFNVELPSWQDALTQCAQEV